MHHRMSLHPAVVFGAAIIIAILGATALFSAFTMPYGLMKLWTIRPSLGALVPALPFLLIVGATSAYGLWYTPSPKLRTGTARLFAPGWLKETIAVAVVATVFVWGAMLLGSWAVVFVDQFADNVISVHLLRSLQNEFAGPVANALSLGFVTSMVNNPVRWSVSLMVVGLSVYSAVKAVHSHAKDGWTPLAASTGLVTGWIADLTVLYVLLAYGVWSTLLLFAVLKLIMDGVREVYFRTQGGVEVLPPQH